MYIIIIAVWFAVLSYCIFCFVKRKPHQVPHEELLKVINDLSEVIDKLRVDNANLLNEIVALRAVADFNTKLLQEEFSKWRN